MKMSLRGENSRKEPRRSRKIAEVKWITFFTFMAFCSSSLELALVRSLVLISKPV